MQIYFLRHARAVEASEWMGLEEERPLTEEGRADIARAAARLAACGFPAVRIVTSPYERAVRTAAIFAETLGMAESCAVDSRLAPGFNRASFEALVADAGREKALLLVGHEPDFSILIGTLTGGSHLELKKGGLARIDWNPAKKTGRLEWLLPPLIWD